MISKLKPYPAMKESGVEWLRQVPRHWDVLKMKQCSARFFAGGTPDSAREDYYSTSSDGIPWLMISDMTRQRKVRNTAKAISESGRASKHLELLPAGTLLYSMYASLGTVSLLEISACVNQAIIGIQLRPSITDSKFGLYFLESIRPHVVRLANTSTQANLNAEKVRNLPIFIPPLTEQAAIVRYMDHVERRVRRFVRAKQKLIVLLEEQKQALIHRAVTRGLETNGSRRSPADKIATNVFNIPWLDSLPSHWKIVAAKRLFSVRNEKARTGDQQLSATQAFGVIPQAEFEQKTGRRVVKISLHLDKRSHVEKGDFVISMRSFQGGLERAWTEGCIRSSYVILNPDENVDRDFFGNLFKSYGYIQALQATSNFIRDGQDLNFDNFCLVDLPLVPKQEQKAIAKFLDATTADITDAVARTSREIELLNEYHTRLIADVVTGKLDVRDAVANLPDETESPGDDIDLIDDGDELTDGFESALEKVANVPD